MEPIVQKPSRQFSIFGIFLILLGVGILFNKLHFLPYGWKTIFWICGGVIGFISVIRAFITKRRGVVFWGSLLFFVSVAMLVHRFAVIDFVPWDVPATFSLALGLSFLMLFLFDPYRIGVLIPVLFFCGYGALFYLWWWDVIDWFEMKYYFQTYWPALVIVWGISLLFYRRK